MKTGRPQYREGHESICVKEAYNIGAPVANGGHTARSVVSNERGRGAQGWTGRRWGATEVATPPRGALTDVRLPLVAAVPREWDASVPTYSANHDGAIVTRVSRRHEARPMPTAGQTSPSSTFTVALRNGTTGSLGEWVEPHPPKGTGHTVLEGVKATTGAALTPSGGCARTATGAAMHTGTEGVCTVVWVGVGHESCSSLTTTQPPKEADDLAGPLRPEDTDSSRVQPGIPRPGTQCKAARVGSVEGRRVTRVRRLVRVGVQRRAGVAPRACAISAGTALAQRPRDALHRVSFHTEPTLPELELELNLSGREGSIGRQRVRSATRGCVVSHLQPTP